MMSARGGRAGVTTRSMTRAGRVEVPYLRAAGNNSLGDGRETSATVRSLSDDSHRTRDAIKRTEGGKSKKDALESHEKEEENECCICLEVPSALEASDVNGCSHIFCFGCISNWADRENSCPLCKSRFTKIGTKRKKKGDSAAGPIRKKMKTVAHRDQWSDYRTILVARNVRVRAVPLRQPIVIDLEGEGLPRPDDLVTATQGGHAAGWGTASRVTVHNTVTTLSQASVPGRISHGYGPPVSLRLHELSRAYHTALLVRNRSLHGRNSSDPSIDPHPRLEHRTSIVNRDPQSDITKASHFIWSYVTISVTLSVLLFFSGKLVAHPF